MPNVVYEEGKYEINYLNITLKIPKNYPFEAPVYCYKNLGQKNITPGNIRALLFCGDFINISPVNILNPKCCVRCTSLLCNHNYNIYVSLTSFFAESILLYKYQILTSGLHLRYVDKLFDFFPYDILQCILNSF